MENRWNPDGGGDGTEPSIATVPPLDPLAAAFEAAAGDGTEPSIAEPHRAVSSRAEGGDGGGGDESYSCCFRRLPGLAAASHGA